jgi:hypothetical protein
VINNNNSSKFGTGLRVLKLKIRSRSTEPGQIGSAVLLAPVGSATFLGPTGSATLLASVGSATLLGPIGSSVLLGPLGSAILLVPVGSAILLGPVGSATLLRQIGSAAQLRPIGSATLLSPIGSAILNLRAYVGMCEGLAHNRVLCFVFVKITSFILCLFCMKSCSSCGVLDLVITPAKCLDVCCSCAEVAPVHICLFIMHSSFRII